MDIPTEARPVAELRDYLAEERTFLAWIRTGISLMGFGFVVARFGIFGELINLPQKLPAGQPHELSVWFGAALIAIGAIVNLFSARRFMRLVGELNRDQFADRSRGVWNAGTAVNITGGVGGARIGVLCAVAARLHGWCEPWRELRA